MLFGGFACTPDNGEEGDNSYAELTVTPASISATLEGTAETLVVTSNATWVATCDQTDVVLSTIAGNGNGTVTVEIPSVTAARNFVIKFVASKMVSVAGVTVPSTHEFDVQVSQNATGTDLNSYAYYEDCGTDVEKDGSYWPYVDAFTGWNPQGASATGVSYKGSNASVRASGNAYQPTADAVGISGQPYVFLNKVPSSANFVIENIAVEGGKNYVFTYNAQCQNAYDGGKPGFATVDGSLIHLELGYDGTNWDAVDCTYTPNGGNGWYAVQVEFKVAADATKLYARFTYEAPASNGGGRFDDFKLVEGGNGAELEVSAPQAPETQDGTIASITTTGNFSVKNAWVIATYAQGFLMTDSSNGILLVYQGNADGVVVPAVGQVVNVSGAVSLYGGLLQFGKDATVEQVAGETKSVSYPTPTTLNYSGIVSYVSNPSIFYAEMKGKLIVKDSGKGYNNYNIELQGGTDVKGSVSYPAAELEATMDALADKWVVVRGYMIGKPNSNAYYANMMAIEVVETEAPETPDTPDTPDTPNTPDVPAVPEGGNALEVTAASVKAAIPDLTTNGYGSQNVTSYSTFLTWGEFAACKLCLPPSGDYATANCLQMQGNTDAAKQGRVGNVSATPKRITKVIVESYNAKYTPNFNLALGTEQVVGTSVPANMIPAETMSTASVVEGNLTKYVSTYEVASGDYTYFAIYKNTTGAFYFTKIRVEYAE